MLAWQPNCRRVVRIKKDSCASRLLYRPRKSLLNERKSIFDVLFNVLKKLETYFSIFTIFDNSIGNSKILGYPPGIFSDVSNIVQCQNNFFNVNDFIFVCFIYLPKFIANRQIQPEILRGAESADPIDPEEPLKSLVHIGLRSLSAMLLGIICL